MNKIKIMSVFGTRPEAAKMCPVIKELKNHSEFEQLVCVTGQHREMLDQILKLFQIVPDYDLNIMKKKQSLTDVTINAIKGIEHVINIEKPGLILVHGDTSTTFAASLAAFYAKIPVGHVEAGLRTYDIYEPFPEEMNRLLTSKIAEMHFAPTELSKNNLLKENIDNKKIYITGNTAIDTIKMTVCQNYKFKCYELNNIDYKNNKIITMTAHRRENLGEPLVSICKAIIRIVETFQDVEVVYAVHLNPDVQNIVNHLLSNHPKIHLIPPIDTDDMHNLISRSYLVMTDSGGIQEEAPSLGKPVIVLRALTERQEGVDYGNLKLAGTNTDSIFKIAKELLTNKYMYSNMCNRKNPFGDGKAGKRIVDFILYKFGFLNERPDEYKI